jgi:hypothetical protein
MYVWVLKIGDNYMALKAQVEVFMDAYIVHVFKLCILYIHLSNDVCVYLFIYIYTYVYIPVYLFIYMYTYIYTCF